MIGRLTDLWIEQLRVLHTIKIRMSEALPRIGLSTSHDEVREFLIQHAQLAKASGERLLAIIAEVDDTFLPVSLEMMTGSLDEWDSSTDDVQLLRSIRKTIHQEISRLAKAENGARVLGYDDLAGELRIMMEQQQYQDSMLAKLGLTIHEHAQRFLAA